MVVTQNDIRDKKVIPSGTYFKDVFGSGARLKVVPEIGVSDDCTGCEGCFYSIKPCESGATCRLHDHGSWSDLVIYTDFLLYCHSRGGINVDAVIFKKTERRENMEEDI